MEITRLDRLARFGYMARAAVYALLGYLALTTSALAHKGPEGEFELLQRVPGGNIMLMILALGLLAYGLYKLFGALIDIDGKGSDFKGILARLVFAGGGAAYLAMCWTAFRFSAGAAAGSPGGKEAAATTLQLPLGNLALALAGLGFFTAAGIQLRKAVTKHFMRMLEPGAPPLTCTIGRIGLAARAAVFAIIGWSLVRGAWHESEDQVRDLGGALAALRGYQTLYVALAFGLIVFAAYSAIEARYRIVPRVDPVEAGKRALA